MRFKLLKGYYIRSYDSFNWVIAKRYKTEKGSMREKIQSYHTTLEGCWNEACDILPLEAENFPQLHSTISQLKSLKLKIKNH